MSKITIVNKGREPEKIKAGLTKKVTEEALAILQQDPTFDRNWEIASANSHEPDKNTPKGK